MIKVKEHDSMTMGTTPNFGVRSSCSWHLQSTTQYSDSNRLVITIKYDLGTAGSENIINAFQGNSLMDIIQNKESNLVLTGSGEYQLIVKPVSDILIVVYGLND